MDAYALPTPVLGRGLSLRGLRRGINVLFVLAVATINAFLDAIGNATAYSEPGLYVKLHIGAPGAAGTANPAANTTRVLASFATAAAGSMTTDTDTLWATVPNAETYSHISLWDASTAGNFVGEQALTASKTVAVGDNFRIPAGSLTISGT